MPYPDGAVAVVCRSYGGPGRPWITRHAGALRRFRPFVVARRVEHAGGAPGSFEVVSLRRRPWLLRFMVRSRGAGLAHIHFLWNAVWFFRFWGNPGIPVVVTAHGSDANIAFEDRAYGRLVRRVLTKVDAVVCVSRYVRDRVAELGCPPGKLIVNPLGVPVDTIGRFRRPVEARPSDTARLVCVAALREEKGHRFLIEAVGKVKGSFPGVRLVLAGDGPLREALERQVREGGLEEAVRFPGWLSGEEVFGLLGESDVYVQPSVRHIVPGRIFREEGFSLGLAEAAAAGLPLAAFRVGGIPEICRHGFNGLLCDERDVDGLAGNILSLLHDPRLRRELGDRGRELARSEFDERVAVDRLEALYAGWIAAAKAGREGRP